MTRSAFWHGWRAHVAIAGAILVLGIINVAVRQSEIDLSPIERDFQSMGSTALRVNDTGSPPTDLSLVETLERPLFSPTRREFVEEEAPAAPSEIAVEEMVVPPEQPPELLLHGTRSIAGVSSALVSINGQDSAWTTVGDEVAGWRVTAVDPDRLLLEQGGDRVSIPLYATGDQ